MKPLHSEISRLHRCPCCQSKYSDQSARKNTGKSAARQKQKRNINREIDQMH